MHFDDTSYSYNQLVIVSYTGGGTLGQVGSLDPTVFQISPLPNWGLILQIEPSNCDDQAWSTPYKLIVFASLHYNFAEHIPMVKRPR